MSHSADQDVSILSIDPLALRLYTTWTLLLASELEEKRKQAAPTRAIAQVVGMEWNMTPLISRAWTDLTTPKKAAFDIRLPSTRELHLRERWL